MLTTTLFSLPADFCLTDLCLEGEAALLILRSSQAGVAHGLRNEVGKCGAAFGQIQMPGLAEKCSKKDEKERETGQEDATTIHTARKALPRRRKPGIVNLFVGMKYIDEL
jgi:hypothetical protein